jgi:hypothetical protein
MLQLRPRQLVRLHLQLLLQGLLAVQLLQQS